MKDILSENQKKKVAVIGIGPVGMILAVHLQEAGLEVAVCDLKNENQPY